MGVHLVKLGIGELLGPVRLSSDVKLKATAIWLKFSIDSFEVDNVGLSCWGIGGKVEVKVKVDAFDAVTVVVGHYYY